MWMYPGPGCSDRSFSTKLDNAEIYTQVWRILALGAHWNSGPSPIPLREGVTRPWVSPLKLASARLCQFLPFLLHLLLLCAGSWVHAQRPVGVILPEDSARQEANRANNERWHARKQRRLLRSAARATVRAWGEETPSESKSSADEEEGEVISSPRAPPPPLISFPRLVTFSVGKLGSQLVLPG
jgi:hypothetical protein